MELGSKKWLLMISSLWGHQCVLTQTKTAGKSLFHTVLETTLLCVLYP